MVAEASVEGCTCLLGFVIGTSSVAGGHAGALATTGDDSPMSLSGVGFTDRGSTNRSKVGGSVVLCDVAFARSTPEDVRSPPQKWPAPSS